MVDDVGIAVHASGSDAVVDDFNQLAGAADRADSALSSVGGGGLRGIDSFLGRINEARNELGNLRSAAEAAQGLGSRLMVGGAAGLAGLAAGVKSTVDAFGEMQRVEGGLESMLGSPEAAKAKIKEIQQFAKDSPFDFGESAKAAQKLLAMGFSADEIIPTLEKVGNAVAAAGGDTEAFTGVLTALGQIQTKGKLSQEELNQIQERGLSTSFLADKLGLTAKELGNIGENGIEAKKGINALLEGFGEVGGGSAMARQMETIPGQASSLGDSFDQLKAKVGGLFAEDATHLIKSLDTLIGKVSEFIEKNPELARTLAYLAGGGGLAAIAGGGALWAGGGIVRGAMDIGAGVRAFRNRGRSGGGLAGLLGGDADEDDDADDTGRSGGRRRRRDSRGRFLPGFEEDDDNALAPSKKGRRRDSRGRFLAGDDDADNGPAHPKPAKADADTDDNALAIPKPKKKKDDSGDSGDNGKDDDDAGLAGQAKKAAALADSDAGNALKSKLKGKLGAAANLVNEDTVGGVTDTIDAFKDGDYVGGIQGLLGLKDALKGSGDAADDAADAKEGLAKATEKDIDAERRKTGIAGEEASALSDVGDEALAASAAKEELAGATGKAAEKTSLLARARGLLGTNVDLGGLGTRSVAQLGGAAIAGGLTGLAAHDAMKNAGYTDGEATVAGLTSMTAMGALTIVAPQAILPVSAAMALAEVLNKANQQAQEKAEKGDPTAQDLHPDDPNAGKSGIAYNSQQQAQYSMELANAAEKRGKDAQGFNLWNVITEGGYGQSEAAGENALAQGYRIQAQQQIQRQRDKAEMQKRGWLPSDEYMQQHPEQQAEFTDRFNRDRGLLKKPYDDQAVRDQIYRQSIDERLDGQSARPGRTDGRTVQEGDVNVEVKVSRTSTRVERDMNEYRATRR